MRVLATLARPDSGTVLTACHDAIRHPAEVRQVTGLTGQYAALDAFQSGSFSGAM